ncbi:MAG: glycerol-3-phosphate 1-O-acyltransferase PlsY [Gemmataceae bacterium]|nr:glycerol-3-phosphate 1-O-acyltransferase PlsY [Gemmataceae bacterium]
MLSTALVVLGSYLIGAIPFGYLIARWRGVDILKEGSGNIGATNVGRVLGRRFGLFVFLLDFAKGAGPVAFARWWSGSAGAGIDAEALPVAAGLAAFLGHLFPIYLRFRGGKGVATSAGVVAVLLPLPALGGLLTWIAVVCATRIVSAASMAAAAALCLFHLILSSRPFGDATVILTVFCFVAAALVFARHHANIGRLLHGTENRLRETPTMLLFVKMIHVLALGLWFGSVIFFTFVVGLSLFGTFEHLSEKPASERPFWLPLPTELAKERPSERFPDPLRKEQGSRIAGAAVGPMFSWYYGIQTVCAILAVATALAWCSSSAGTIHKVRAVVLVLGLVSVGIGWWLDIVVNRLRDTRATTSDVVLTSAAPTPVQLDAANQARAEFGKWHMFSLFANFATVALVTVGMTLAAQLPPSNGEAQTLVAPRETVASA